VIDPRIYRAAFGPTLVALIVLMFSVEPVPDPLRGAEAAGIAASDFDENRASALARQIVDAAPEREPGSRGDTAAGDFVEERFAAIGSGKVSEQRYEDSFEGDDVGLRNVLVTLPGTSERMVVVMAHRDSAEGPGATSSAAATGALIELAGEFGRLRHDKTLIFVSTDGGSDGASGARMFLQGFPTPQLLDAVVVLSQPGTPSPEPPYVIPSSTGPESTSAQLVQTAKAALETETDRDAGLEGPFASLFRLALPSGLGEQAPLIEGGADAVAISSAGERPVEPADDQLDSLTASSVGEFGRTAFSLVLAIDETQEPLAHGPDGYVPFAGNLIPGWALALLALALLLPALLGALDALARAGRQGEPLLPALSWVLARALPFLAALALLYVLAVPGIAPAPAFPFDPARFEFGWRAAGVLVATLAAFLVVLVAVRPLTATRRASSEALGAAIGAVASLSVLGIWLLNPYLALLLVPFAHLWLLAARPGMPVALPVAAAVTLLAALPAFAALAYLVGRLELGAEAPWQLMLMITGGQIGAPLALLFCLVAGSALAVLAVARSRADLPAPAGSLGGRVGYPGPGSLGGTR
jgi:hypothetical protein